MLAAPPSAPPVRRQARVERATRETQIAVPAAARFMSWRGIPMAVTSRKRPGAAERGNEFPVADEPRITSTSSSPCGRPNTCRRMPY